MANSTILNLQNLTIMWEIWIPAIFYVFWFIYMQELPDTLDVHIAQREFEAAMEIILEAEATLADMEDAEAVRELREANSSRKEALIQVGINKLWIIF